jgi:predicted SprT family Zn-dependent metalloprotease
MITTQQFQTLDDLFAFYNVKLFGAALPECIVNLSRRPHSYGFFAPNLWASINNESSEPSEFAHEISLNPDFLLRPSIEWHTTLVHEITHLWQHEHGKPSRLAYHNKQWSNKMESIGLMPSDTGLPGGARTGQRMSEYVIPDGAFEKVFLSIDPEELELLRLKYLPVISLASPDKNPEDDDPDAADGEGDAGNEKNKSKSGRRIKYTCSCGNNLWARSGLSVQCLECDNPFQEED